MLTVLLQSCSSNTNDFAEEFDIACELTLSVSGIESIECNNSQVRATDDVTDGTLDGRLDSLMLCVVDESGKVVQRRTIKGGDLVTGNNIRVTLTKGIYNIYLLGDGKNTSFNDTRSELQSNITNRNSNWITTIAWYTARKEWFHAASGTIRVDGSGDALSGKIELRRVVGRVDVTLIHNPTTVISGAAVGLDLGVVPTSITVDGRYIFPNPLYAKQDGLGNYCICNAPDGVSQFSFFSLPTIGSVFTGRIFVNYQENGIVKSKVIPLTNYKVEANRVTEITALINK